MRAAFSLIFYFKIMLYNGINNFIYSLCKGS
nr:MAG TPA: hypothetical protein [Bacteriophage sp.]